MTKHKWHKEIKAWADGAEIEMKYDFMCGWNVAPNPDWDTDLGIFRIKPQPKEPQYLYVYNIDGKTTIARAGEFTKVTIVNPKMEYLGKIKLEQDDE